jgi:phosphatidylglycerol:prolipoprotein diacylglycerol transferase
MFSEPYVNLPGLTINSVALAALCGFMIAAALAVWWLRGLTSPLRVLDVCLAVLAVALVGGRLLHVALFWPHFRAQPSDVLRLTTGGLDWHGALLGSVLAAWLTARWRCVPFAPIAGAAALALPVLFMLIWQGCAGWGCAYGREIDSLANYPALLVAERRDLFGIAAPRFDTPTLGTLWGAFLVMIAAALTTTRWPPLRRLWLMVSLCSAGMFIMGFVRGDSSPMLAGLRADQWFDIGLCILGPVVLFIIESRRAHNAERERAV